MLFIINMHMSTCSKVFFNCLLHRLTKTWNRGRPETKINIVCENCTILFAILIHAFVFFLKQSISRMRAKKPLLLKEIRFPHRTSPYTYCNSLFPNQFSLLSKASPSDCDFSVQIIRYRAPVLISPSFRFPHLFHHHYPPYQSPPRPWYICFCLRNLQQRHFRFCLLRIHPVSLQWEIPMWNKMLSLRTRTKIQIRNILHFLKFKN